MTQDRIVEKLKKIHNMAEGAAAIGNEKEAQAFAEMFQRLATEHKIEMSDIEFSRLEETDPVARYEIDYQKYGDFKTRKVRVAWMERLASIIARAHFCRIIVWSGSTRVSLCGRKQDVEVAEYMIVTLQRAAEKIADTETQKYRWEVYKRDRHCRAAQGFRSAFLQAFVMHLSDRYEAFRRAQTQGGETSTALVRLRKEERAVEDFMQKLRESKETRNASGLRRVAEFHGVGAARGRAAADKIELGGTAIKSDSTKRRELA